MIRGGLVEFRVVECFDGTVKLLHQFRRFVGDDGGVAERLGIERGASRLEHGVEIARLAAALPNRQFRQGDGPRTRLRPAGIAAISAACRQPGTFKS